MKAVLHRLGLRYALGLAALALVAGIVVVARLRPHQAVPPAAAPRNAGTASPFVEPSGATTPGSDPGGPGAPPASGTPAEGVGSPGATPGLYPPEPPQILPGVPGPGEVGLAFARAWLQGPRETPETWLRNLSLYTTPGLAAELAGADPSNVPATRITDQAATVDDTPTSCEVDVPTDAGTLLLTLDVQPAGAGSTAPGAGGSPAPSGSRWLVAAVDWRPV